MPTADVYLIKPEKFKVESGTRITIEANSRKYSVVLVSMSVSIARGECDLKVRDIELLQASGPRNAPDR
jgi:hypothetical protein